MDSDAGAVCTLPASVCKKNIARIFGPKICVVIFGTPDVKFGKCLHKM